MPDDHAPAAGDRPATGALATSVEGAGPTLVLAHGFTQTGRLWGGLRPLVARHHRLVLADLPGHGRSAQVRADLPGAARLLGRAGGPGDYLGYSLGARVVLHLALDRPDLVRRLVLVSATAGLDDPAERAERRRSDEALADRLDPPGGGPPADTVETFVRRWVANPLFGDAAADADGLAERRTNSAAGLASSLRLCGTGTQEPLWDRLAGLEAPLLVVTGERDAKFCALGRRMVAAVGSGAALAVIPGADHAPHLQRPDEVAAAVEAHLAG